MELNGIAPKATYGEVLIRQALDAGAVDTLLLEEDEENEEYIHLQISVNMNGRRQKI